MKDFHMVTERIKTLISVYGLTQNTNDAGFILPDGTMLNLQRAKHGNKIYHTEVLALFDIEETDLNLNQFMKEERIVRFSIVGVIHIENKLTEEQLNTLTRIVKYRSYPFELICPNKIESHIISHKKELRKYFNNTPYYGNKVLVSELSDRRLFINGETRKPIATFIKRTNKYFYKSEDAKKNVLEFLNHELIL